MYEERLKQQGLERRLRAGLTEEDSNWLDKLDQLAKQAPDGISKRIEACTTGDDCNAIAPLVPLNIFSEWGDKSQDYCSIINILDLLKKRYTIDKEKKVTAEDTLDCGIECLKQRGEGYDSCKERSMTKTVAMFNELTSHKITETDGWQFMVLLKMVRHQQGEYNHDNLFDGVNYMALAVESASKEKHKK